MIKLLHTADWHLGKMFFGRSMLEDQKYFFDRYFFPTLQQLDFGQNDCIILAGDIFDRAVPPVEAIALFDEVLNRIAEMRIKLFAVTGNHDGASRMSMGIKLMQSAGIYLFTSLDDCCNSLTLDDGVGTRAILHPLPHFDISEGRAYLKDDECVKYSDCFKRIISNMNTSEPDALHILAAHCTAFPESYLREGDSDEKSVGGSDIVDNSAFEPFALTALGHIHRELDVTKRVFYCGSPLGYSFDSANVLRTMKYYELEGSEVRSRSIPIDRPLHPLVKLSGSFEQLISDITPSSDAYIFARLSDTALVYEPMFRLRQKFPNILGLSYSDGGSGNMSSEYRSYLRSSLHSRSIGDTEVFEAFLSQMCGAKPSSDDLTLFEKLRSDAFSMEE